MKKSWHGSFTKLCNLPLKILNQSPHKKAGCKFSSATGFVKAIHLSLPVGVPANGPRALMLIAFIQAPFLPVVADVGGDANIGGGDANIGGRDQTSTAGTKQAAAEIIVPSERFVGRKKMV